VYAVVVLYEVVVPLEYVVVYAVLTGQVVVVLLEYAVENENTVIHEDPELVALEVTLLVPTDV
jgi:hypothetical protein